MDFSAYDALAQEIADRYNAAAAQAAAARQRAAQAAYDAMMQNQGNINANSDEAARQAYIQYMNNQKALPQQMAASGLNGGATESSMVGLNTAYGENVNSVNMERNKALKELAAQAAAAKANAEMGIGDIYGNAAMNIANAQQSILTQKLADQMAYERAKYEAAQSNLSSASRSSGSSGSGLNLNLGGYTNSSSSNNGLTYKTVGSGSTKSPVQSSGSYVPLKQYASGVKR
jgi:hypothetical protein